MTNYAFRIAFHTKSRPKHPPAEALVAHPEMRLAADDEDPYSQKLGEENQDEDQ
ncbi:hypothetical protein [Auritidibacter ignavus]|uniref:hypothetical protein n=1 Tax=Auritidibacter ignavus TaxID=678932 RepID=UPI0015D5C992|nr:hypothetical protein [Auritidibacter ignavus]